MNWKIDERDSLSAARLKLLYLVPLSVAATPFVGMYLTWTEYVVPSARTIRSILRTGRP